MSRLPFDGSPSPTFPRPPAPRLRRVARSFPALRAIAALVLREMSTRYGRSPGGYIWAILEPLGGIIILAIGFSLLLRTPTLGNSFLLFYATGFLPYQIYASLSGVIAKSINFSRALLFYPAVTWVDAMVARFLLNGLTGLLVTYILLVGIFTFTGTGTNVDIPEILLALGLAMLLGGAVGVLNCVLTGLFAPWDNIWSILTRPLFLMSGVLFLYEDMPRNVQAILWWNPLMHITGIMREGAYATYDASYVSVTFVLIVSLVVLTLGLVLMGRFHRTLLNR